MAQDEISTDAYHAADDVIDTLKRQRQVDYSTKRDEIARHFDDVVWHGNWVSHLRFENGTPSLNFYQEDEYDQHMDEDEKPDIDDVVYAAGHYITIG
jgi:hypothetical protein